MSNTTPNPPKPSRFFMQGVFIAWLVVINILYYLQFKGLLISRLAALVRK
jgi:hypothetical protein